MKGFENAIENIKDDYDPNIICKGCGDKYHHHFWGNCSKCDCKRFKK